MSDDFLILDTALEYILSKYALFHIPVLYIYPLFIIILTGKQKISNDAKTEITKRRV